MNPQIYYRNLWLPELVQRWQNRQFTSSTEMHPVPPQWMILVEQGAPATEYPLQAGGTIYLPAARDSFAAFAFRHRHDFQAAFTALPQATRHQMLEVAGLNAFKDPVWAYWYGQQPADLMLATFYGFKVCELGPEASQTGIVAAVIKPIRIYKPEDFASEFFAGSIPPNPHPVIT